MGGFGMAVVLMAGGEFCMLGRAWKSEREKSMRSLLDRPSQLHIGTSITLLGIVLILPLPLTA